MKHQITPCLWFNNQAKEAATTYSAAFDEAQITSQSSLITEMTLSGHRFILLDGGPMYQPNPSISFFYICETRDEFDKAWNLFSKDGNVLMPKDKYPWSEYYGWISDRYNISWQLSVGSISEVGQKITPCLMFTGNQYGKAEEAIELYSSIFKNTTVDGILRYSALESPDQEGKVKHAQMVLDGQKLMLMESAMEHPFSFTEGISLTIYCDTQEEINKYWNKFTESGQESMCGWLKDKFGISWQIIPAILGKIMRDPAKAGKAMQALMKMRKIEIEELLQASNA